MTGSVRHAIAVAVITAFVAGSVPARAQQAAAAANALQGTRSGLFSSIVGTAVSWNNTGLPNAPIRLRDARLGRVIGSVTTDRFGAFEFGRLEPGSYVVELLNSSNDAVLASTTIINVNSGQSVAALIRLPSRTQPIAGAFGRSVPSALALTSAAVAAGVLATSVAGAPATDRALPGQR